MKSIFEEFPELKGVFLEEFLKYLRVLRKRCREFSRNPEGFRLDKSFFQALEGIKDSFSFVDLYEPAKLMQRWVNLLRYINEHHQESILTVLTEFKKAFEFLEDVFNAVNKDLPLPPVENLLQVVENLEQKFHSSQNPSSNPKTARTSTDNPTETEDQLPADFSEFVTEEIIENFVVETNEILENLSTQLLHLEKNPDNLEIINCVFRGFHSIKGNCGFIGFKELEALSHAIEDILNKIRNGQLQLTSEMIDLFLSSLDVIQKMLIEYKNKQPISDDWKGIVRNCEEILESSDSSPEVRKISPPSRKDAPQSAPHCPQLVDDTIRVHVQRLDRLMNLVGELVLVRNRMNQLLWESEDFEKSLIHLEELRNVGDQFNFLITEIQNTVMQTRLVPIGRIFNKFPRMVRDLARSAGKKIKVIIEGESTEVDKSVIEVIGDPLMHILRNAVDHGIETPEERAAAGKPPEGTIWLSARHEGNNIVITCRDDGKGIDAESILKAALDKKIITNEQAQSLRKPDILNLIFLPGFSTAAQVTAISGRGVGLDVVKSNITRLNGFIELDSEKGKGTTFTLRFPLTMAIVQGLLVKVVEEIYIVPISSVLETLRGLDIPLKEVNGVPTTIVRDQIIPLLDLQEILLSRSGLNGGNELEKNFSEKYIVLVGHAEKRMGLIVDRLIGEEEVVIKPLGKVLGKIPGISGATILGDGRVRLILDVGGLIRMGNLQNIGA